MNTIFKGVVISMCSLPAFAWTTLPTSDPNITFEVDEKSISKRGTTVKFLEKITYGQPVEIDPVSGKLIHEKTIHRIVDCAANSQGILKGTLFGENRSLIESVSFTETKINMQLIPTGTLAETELNLVCRAVQLRR